MSERFLNPVLCMLFIGVLVLAAYLPGLSGGFVFDDYQTIVHNQALDLDALTVESLARAALSSGAGPTGRPIAQISFALNRYFGGLDPWAYKFSNLLIHVLNGILVFFLASRLASLYKPDIPRRSAVGFGLALALLWALHPLNVSTVLYVVQRMTSLSATFTLLSLLVYVGFRVRLAVLSPVQVVLWLVFLVFFMLCGVYTKENAALTPYFILLVEYLVFGFKCDVLWKQRCIGGGFALIFFVPVLWMIGKIASDPEWVIRMHAGRDYLLSDYLLSQGRVLWFYLQSILVPNIAALGLHHDDFLMSRDLFSPISTAFALLGHAAMLGIAWWARKRFRVVTFGILWFYVGHLLESTIIPLILVFEHRNYLPSLGPLTILVWGIFQATVPERQKLLALALAVFVAFSLTMLRAQEWGDFLGFPLRQAEKHPNSVRANFDAGRTLGLFAAENSGLADEYGPQSMYYLQRAADAPVKLPEPYMAAFQLASFIDVPVPDDFLQRLAAVLRSEQPPNNVFYLFSGLRDLYFNERKPLSVDDGVFLFEAARENPRLLGNSRGHMLASYALFMRDHELDNHKAQMLAEEATRFAPGFLDNRILAGWLSYENGDFAKARLYLAEAEAADKFRVLESDIGKLRSALEHAGH
jgi:protein O-mannosyl-transferase